MFAETFPCVFHSGTDGRGLEWIHHPKLSASATRDGHGRASLLVASPPARTFCPISNLTLLNQEDDMETQPDILIVEDDRDLVSSMRVVLESKQYQVREAYNGKQGFAKIEEKIPDLIILDVMMSTETEGFDLAYKIQNTPQFSKIPILMLTSFPRKMMEEGPEKFQHILGEFWPVAKFIEKPVEPGELLSAVANLLSQQTLS